MDPTSSVLGKKNSLSSEAFNKVDSSSSSSEKEKVHSSIQDVFNSKYPAGSTVTQLSSTFEIKQRWLFSEWAQECKFSPWIRQAFPDREDLRFGVKNPKVDLICSTFDRVRGKYLLWKSPREEGRWKKVETQALHVEWVVKNVEVLYPSKEQFSVSALDGIVLWKEPSSSGKKYKLYEGNHRISAWIASKAPQTLPAIIFIGKPKK